MRTLTRPLTMIVFFVIALVPVVLFDHGGPGHLSPYQLARAPFPNYFAPHTFRQMGDWFADRIGLRNLFVEIGALLNLEILRISTNRNVLIGNHGWLFWSDYEKEPAVMMLDVRGELRFQSTEISNINSNLHGIADAFARCGKTVLITIAPNKQSIYGENLLPESKASSRLDDLLGKLDPSARSIILDAREPLKKAKGTQRLPLYFKTDSHWNELGAFEVYHEIVQRLARVGTVYLPELAGLDHYDVKVEPSAGGDLSVQMLQAPWLFSDDTVHLLPKSELPRAEQVYINQSSSIYQNNQGKGRLVLIGDSFSPLLARFLSSHFKEVDHQLVAEPKFDASVAARSGADVEILEVVERHLFVLQSPPLGLRRMCSAPS
jgi:hypothetical protein